MHVVLTDPNGGTEELGRLTACGANGEPTVT